MNSRRAGGIAMNTNAPIPSVADVQRIATIEDPVIRNLQITQCYHELSTVMAQRTGIIANWCTFATWASKQAGQTIRKEDLARLLESRLKQSQAVAEASERVATTAHVAGAAQMERLQEPALTTHDFKTAIERASEAVSRGNKKVFEEIGYEFARFYEVCLQEERLDDLQVARFCLPLRRGEPPEGQNYLRQAFTHYARALSENDAKQRAELILLANLKIGFHEQTRLQPEIAESLDAGLISSLQFTRALLPTLFPSAGWFRLANLYVRRILGRPTALDLTIRSLLEAARSHLRWTITEVMMTIALPSGVKLRLGEDLRAAFPDSLREISNPELRSFLEEYDPTPDSPVDSGALDWADLPDRLHFIIDLFRCYQEYQELFAPPFTPEQVVALKEGRRPGGSL